MAKKRLVKGYKLGTLVVSKVRKVLCENASRCSVRGCAHIYPHEPEGSCRRFCEHVQGIRGFRCRYILPQGNPPA